VIVIFLNLLCGSELGLQPSNTGLKNGALPMRLSFNPQIKEVQLRNERFEQNRNIPAAAGIPLERAG
jgi:hypothetical protein